MAEFTLDCFLESGNSYKPALMLELCGADWEPRRIAFFSGETRAADYRENRNIMGEAPVLAHHLPEGDLLLSQSGVILEYLADQTGRFGPADEAERREILRWMLWDNHKFTSYTATARFRRVFLNKPDDPVTEFFSERATSAWRVLETHLSSRDFVAADRPTIADISLCGYLYWPDQIQMDLTTYPAIAAWLARIAALPGYKRPEELMPSGIDPVPAIA